MLDVQGKRAKRIPPIRLRFVLGNDTTECERLVNQRDKITAGRGAQKRLGLDLGEAEKLHIRPPRRIRRAAAG
jgi:hypothetical protein